jgi:hypothetical protein
MQVFKTLNDAAKPFATSIIAQNLLYAQTTAVDKNLFKVGADNGWKLMELM